MCKERHQDAARWEDRSEHHHAATFASTTFRWKKIAQYSVDKYQIHFNAVAHDAYVTMFNYLRAHSAKKPLHELDATPFF